MAEKTHTYEWQPTRHGRKLVRVPIKAATASSGAALGGSEAASAPRLGGSEAASAPRLGGSEPEPEPKPASVYMSKAELVALAEERGVDSSGTRPELMERLALDD